MNEEKSMEPSGVVGKRLKWFLGIAAALLWGIALFLPAYSDGTPGIACFLFGWSMLFDGHTFAFLAWFGNLPFCIAFFMFLFATRRSGIRNAAIFAGVGFLFAFGAFTITEITHGETGTISQVDAVSGTYVWLLSHLVLLGGTAMCFYHSRKT